jgi:hypothetical protein
MATLAKPSAIPAFQQYIGQFYWWRKLEYSEKTIDLLQITDKLPQLLLLTILQIQTYLLLNIVLVFIMGMLFTLLQKE